MCYDQINWHVTVYQWSAILYSHVALEMRKNAYFTVFSNSSFCGGSAQRCRDIIEREYTTTNLPLINTSRLFRSSNSLMAKWRSQTLSFESVTDKQKKSDSGVLNPSPTKLATVIEEVRTILARSKGVRIRRMVSPLRGAQI